MPTVNVAVAMTVPTIQRMSRVSRFAIPVRCSAICVRKARVEVRNLRPHLGEAGPELVGGDVVALLEAIVNRLGDDLGLVALDAAGGELLGDGERVEHRGQPTSRRSRSGRRVGFRRGPA